MQIYSIEVSYAYSSASKWLRCYHYPMNCVEFILVQKILTNIIETSKECENQINIDGVVLSMLAFNENDILSSPNGYINLV